VIGGGQTLAFTNLKIDFVWSKTRKSNKQHIKANVCKNDCTYAYNIQSFYLLYVGPKWKRQINFFVVVKRYAVGLREAKKWKYAVRKTKIWQYAVRKGGVTLIICRGLPQREITLSSFKTLGLYLHTLTIGHNSCNIC